MVLQSETVIIKWDRKQLPKIIKVYYKVHEVLQSVTEIYYKVCQVLQSVIWGYYMVGRVLFHRSLKIYFIFSFLFENLVDNTKNWYYKVRQLSQNETENNYQKLLKFIKKCIRYYKVWQKFITKCVRCFKGWGYYNKDVTALME